jgi:hypothetical protein
MALGLVVTARIRVTAATARVTGRCTTRMSATTGVRMPPATNVRMPAARDIRVSTAEVTGGVRGTATRVPMRGASTRIAVRRATTGSARMATPVVASYRMATARRAMTFGTGTRMPSSTGATTILGSVTAGARVVRYIVRGATVRSSVRGNNASSGELTRSRSGGHARSTVVKRRAQLSITRSGMLMITLQRRGLEMMVMFRCELVSSRMRLDTTGAVERHVVPVVDNGPVVYVGDMNTTHVHGRAIIKERTTAPVTAFESNTAITEPVIHTAVETDMRTPVAAVPGIDATAPAPVPRCPQQSGRRRQHPSAGHPVITIVTVGPLAGRPHVPRRRQRRLHVHRENRRRDVDRHAYRNTGV